MLRNISNSPGKPWSQSWRRKGRLRWEEFAEKEVLSLELKSEGVMDDKNGAILLGIESAPLSEDEDEW